MYGLPTMDAASRVCAPLAAALSTNADIDPFAKKIESVSNKPSIISRRNSSEIIDSSNLQGFFEGWPKIERVFLCHGQSGSVVSGFNSAKKGRAPLPPSQAVMHFSSAKKERAPLPPSQAAAHTTTHRLAVNLMDSSVSTVAGHHKNPKKGFLGHLRAMWKRIDLPLIDILPPKY